MAALHFFYQHSKETMLMYVLISKHVDSAFITEMFIEIIVLQQYPYKTIYPHIDTPSPF